MTLADRLNSLPIVSERKEYVPFDGFLNMRSNTAGEMNFSGAPTRMYIGRTGEMAYVVLKSNLWSFVGGEYADDPVRDKTNHHLELRLAAPWKDVQAIAVAHAGGLEVQLAGRFPDVTTAAPKIILS
jgi:hypothetical protein